MARKELNGSYAIDIDNLLNSTRRKQNYRSSRDTPLIRKIKSHINDGDKKDYEPSIVSIGPYHHDKLAAKSMEVRKYECLDYILKLNPHKKLEDYIEAIKGMEKQIRSCYGDEIEMDRKNFLKMLLVDGCFIIITLLGVDRISTRVPKTPSNKGIEMKIDKHNGECIIDMESIEAHENQQNIQNNNGNEVNEFDDSYHIRMWYSDLLLSDILLSENQIPFFVITKIYEIAKGRNNTISLLNEGIAELIEGNIECYPTSITAFNRPKDFHHLFHLCHMYFKPSERSFERYESLDLESGCWRQATKYRKSGIKFKPKELFCDDPHSLLDIEFCDGRMEIPCLNINHNTRRLFRNLIAFEHACPMFGNYVSAYVVFWSQFVRTPDDVALLTKRGIIAHQLNSDEDVSDLFAKLRESVAIDFDRDCYLNSTYYELELHYQRNKPRLMTWLGSIASNLHHWAKQGKLKISKALTYTS